MAEQEKQVPKGKQLRKISPKTVFGEINFERLVKEKSIDIMDVYGVITRTSIVSSDYGDSVKFGGQFRAMNLETGELFRSSVLYLPKFMQDEIAGSMVEGSTAEFAVRMRAEYNKESATKYIYMADTLVEAQEMDQFKALESKVNSAVKALPKPQPKK